MLVMFPTDDLLAVDTVHFNMHINDHAYSGVSYLFHLLGRQNLARCRVEVVEDIFDGNVDRFMKLPDLILLMRTEQVMHLVEVLVYFLRYKLIPYVTRQLRGLIFVSHFELVIL